MNVQVIDRLPAISVRVDDRPEACAIDTFLVRHFGNEHEHFPEQSRRGL
jgi:hypothetical protein